MLIGNCALQNNPHMTTRRQNRIVFKFKRKPKACLNQSGSAQQYVNTMPSSDLSSRLALSYVNMEQRDYSSRTALHIAAAEGDT